MILVIIILCGCEFTGNFGFVSIAPKHDGLFSELLAYSLAFGLFYVVFYSTISLLAIIEWLIICSFNKDFWTGKQYRSYHGVILEHNEKYDKESDDVQKLCSIVSIIEYSILFFMFMFGIIQI